MEWDRTGRNGMESVWNGTELARNGTEWEAGRGYSNAPARRRSMCRQLAVMISAPSWL